MQHNPKKPYPHESPAFPRICVSLSGEGMIERATALLSGCTFFEFRLDTLPNTGAFLPALGRFLHSAPQVVAIATCRRTPNGGSFDGSAVEEAAILRSAAEAGVRIVDLSIETAEELEETAPEILSRLRDTTAALLLSWHDFVATPPLGAVYERIARFAPELLKIVPTATSLDDSLCLLELLKKHADTRRLVAMSMGTPGVLTRALGPRFGSVFTFAAPDAESATAPGQVDLQTLRDVYRIDSITPATRIYGVFGDPITSSKSPAMLNAAFAATGTDAVYLPLQTSRTEELFRVADALPLQGASVTMPLKEKILPTLAGYLDPLAATIGAANTLVRREDARTLHGYNTDAAGIVDPLVRRIPLEGARILVLGAGGAARAGVFALRAQGAEIYILNRSIRRAEALAEQSGATVLTRAEAASMRFDAVINATPHGMRGQRVECPLDVEEMDTTVFFDLVYNPLETPLLQAARAQDIHVIPGVEMFLAQGAAQFTLWTGQPAPETAMREAVLRALR